MRVLHISDTHLRQDDPVALPGWALVEALVAELRPGLIVHTGDIIRDDPFAAADHRFAAAAQRALGVEVLSIPGNHDIGDGPPDAAGPDPGLIDQFRVLYGPEHWARRAGDWRLIGVNSLLFGTGGAAEAEEWAWLEAVLQTDADRPAALFLHKPPFLVSAQDRLETSNEVPLSARARLWALAKRHSVRLIGCGHRHEYRVVLHEGIQIVWAPTTSSLPAGGAAPLPARAFPGVVEYAFDGDTVVHRCIPFAVRNPAWVP